MAIEQRPPIRHRVSWSSDHEARVDDLIAVVPVEPMPATPVRHGRIPRRFGLAVAVGVVVVGGGVVAAGFCIGVGLYVMGLW